MKSVQVDDTISVMVTVNDFIFFKLASKFDEFLIIVVFPRTVFYN